MKRPVRATIVFGAFSALTVMPLAWGLAGVMGWSPAFKLVLWLDLSVYAILLARWSGQRTTSVIFPLALLLGAALWPGGPTAFLLLGLGVLSWIRSGVCFRDAPVRAAAAEAATAAGGAGLVSFLGPHTALTWAVSIWLFALVQALYFFLVPVADAEPESSLGADPFDQAHREALRVLDEAG